MSWNKQPMYNPTLIEPPELPEAEVVYNCSWCDADIVEGDNFYKIYDKPVCDDCIYHCRETATLPEEPDYDEDDRDYDHYRLDDREGD